MKRPEIAVLALAALLAALITFIIWLRKAENRTRLMKALNENAIRFTRLVASPQLRSDTQGAGHYGAPRGNRQHQGVDVKVTEGEPVYAPMDGVITRVAYPYVGDYVYQGLVLEGSGPFDGLQIKMFYVQPIKTLIGQAVERGQIIGYAQSISKKYSPEMTDHVHAELRVEGQLTDPTNYFLFT